jgi:hypothetical protein
MNKFTIRVELVGAASSDNYQTLHEQMTAQGFSREIESGDGVTYELPNAEYDFAGEFSRKEVLEKAKTAAQSTGLSYRVLVTESRGRMWFGLRKAD